MNRRNFTGLALGASAAVAFGQTKPDARKKPNVLLVIADEWRQQAFGHAGDENAHTPAFDNFVRESVEYRQMVSGHPVCCPARASLFTGEYPLKDGVYINDVELKPTRTTFGEAFKKDGYKTGYIGKWHLYGSPDGMYGRRESFIPPDKHMGFDYWKVAECCHDYNHSFYYEGSDPTKRYWQGYDAIAQTNDACQFIKDHKDHSEEPYCLVLSWGPPHFPLASAPEQYRKLYENRDIKLRPNVPVANEATAIKDLRGYYAHIHALNDCFATLMQAVRDSGAEEDTIVVFLSDHGDMMESQGLATKLYPWEESVRVPLLIRYPRHFGSTGHSSDALISMVDVMPTVLSLAGLQIPAGVQGADFATSDKPARPAGPNSSVFLNMAVPITAARTCGMAEYRGVRNEQYTYVRSPQGPWLLYDNANDPYQKQNLCGLPATKPLQDKLDAELNVWLRDLKDEFQPAETYLERDGLTNYMEPYQAVNFTVSPWRDWTSSLVVGPLSVDAPIKNLLASNAAKNILKIYIPNLDQHDLMKGLGNLSVRELQHTRLHLSSERFAEMETKLRRLQMS